MAGVHFQEPEIWQDKEIRFDCSVRDLRCRRGEHILEVLVSQSGSKMAMATPKKWRDQQMGCHVQISGS